MDNEGDRGVCQLKVSILGAGKEVGRSAILVEEGDSRVLFDYGVAISEDEPGFPLHVKPRDLSAIFLSHAHLDHCGALPLLYVSEQKPLYMTVLTLEIAKILIMDFLKVSRYYVPYEVVELQAMAKNVRLVDYQEVVSDQSFTVEVYDAGHIPGSASFLLDIDGKKVLYTGDFNTRDTCLLEGSAPPMHEADIIIMEATYSLYDHPPRDVVEKAFIGCIEEVLDGGGVVLIPSFSVGRSQEILCVLEKYDVNDYPVYVDGMARVISEILLENDRFLRDPSLFRRSLEGVTKISSARQRKEILKKKPCIIVSPAGMLKGGPAIYYAERIANDPRNGIFFVSFQAPNSNGKLVLSEGILPLAAKKGKAVRARVEWFDFSSHSSKRDLVDLLSRADTSAKVVIVHCTERGGEFFKKYIEESLDLEVFLPNNGDEIVFPY
ncbi:MAG: MBL fold metallo-hydrolase [Thermoprotei archaeon]|nr:MAG: MBL fold metallo-hydrolase [Thermoprotei archaeon]